MKTRKLLPERAEKRRDLRSIMGDGMAFSVMVGSGESYFAAFALALGLGDVSAGLISTLPMWVGSVLQLMSPLGVSQLRSYRRWVVLCAVLQAASFAPLILGAWIGQLDQWLLFAVASLYWGFGMATGPAWNAWVGSLVPEGLRARFFATRARWSQLALVLGLGFGGWLLEFGPSAGWSLEIFAAVFSVALVARSISAYFLWRQREPDRGPLEGRASEVQAVLKVSQGSSHTRLLLYLLVFHFAVSIASPFFTPYMFGPLGLSYAEFTLLTALAFVARVISLPRLGRMAQRSGTKRLLWIGSIGIVPLPALWLVSDHVVYLGVLQLLSGVAWAAFELATLLSFFEQIPAERRTRVLSSYNLAHATAILAGSALGGWLLQGALGDPGGYLVVMVVSTVARLLACLGLRGIRGRLASGPPIALRTISVRPSSGGLQRPVLPVMKARE